MALGTVLATGLLLIWADRFSLSQAVSNWTLWVKLGAVLALLGLLSYIHFYIQPQVEGLISQVQPDQPPPTGVLPQVGSLRLRRKRISAICLFTVLTAVVTGARMMLPVAPVWLTLMFVALAAIFAYRTFRAPLSCGWF